MQALGFFFPQESLHLVCRFCNRGQHVAVRIAAGSPLNQAIEFWFDGFQSNTRGRSSAVLLWEFSTMAAEYRNREHFHYCFAPFAKMAKSFKDNFGTVKAQVILLPFVENLLDLYIDGEHAFDAQIADSFAKPTSQ